MVGQNELIASLLQNLRVRNGNITMLRANTRQELDARLLSQARRVNTTHDLLFLDEPASIPTLSVRFNGASTERVLTHTQFQP